MQVSNWSKILVVGVSIALLTGCSSLKGKKGGVDGDFGAQAAGITEQGGFDGMESAADKLRAPAKHSYLFEFDSYEVSQDDIPSINAQAKYLVAHPDARIRLEGNADDRGSREYNIALGWRRARAVAAILQQQGIGEKQIVMLSYGKEKPVSFGSDETSYKLNRRVDLMYEVE